MKNNKVMVVAFAFVGLVFCGMAGQVLAEDAVLLLEQGNGFFDKHYYKQAKEVYQSIIAGYPESTYAKQAQEKMVIMDLATLSKQADRLSAHHHYSQAEAIYQSIAKDYPSNDYALWAQRKLINIYIVTGRGAEAGALFGRMVADFAGNEQLPKVVHEIGSSCRWNRKYDEAEYYYNYVIEHWAGSDMAVWSQKDMVKVSIESGNQLEAQQRLDRFKSKFAGHPQLPEALCSIAEGYIKARLYDKANELNQYVVSQWPGSKQGLNAQKNLVKSYIKTVDSQRAQTATDELKTNFKNVDGYAEAVGGIAYYAYREAGHYSKAIELYQYLVDSYPNDAGRINFREGLAIANIWYRDEPDDPNTEEAIADFEAEFAGRDGYVVAAFQIGEGYYKKGRELAGDKLSDKAKGNLVKAIAVWQRVVSQPFVVGITERAYCTMGHCYILLEDYDNAISHYQQAVTLATDWPDSKKYAIEAQKYLAIASISKGDNAEAQQELEQLVAKYKDSDFLPQLVFHIGEEYYNKALDNAKEGRTDEAKEFYGKALNVWKVIIFELDVKEKHRLAATYFYCGICEQKLGRLNEAIEDFQMVVDYWPDYMFAADAQRMIIVCHRSLRML